MSNSLQQLPNDAIPPQVAQPALLHNITQTPPIIFNPQQPDRETYMLLRQMDRETGWLGKVFGSSLNAPVYIVGTVAILMVVAGCIASFIAKEKAGVEVWTVLAAPLTGILGFLFGRGQTNT